MLPSPPPVRGAAVPGQEFHAAGWRFSQPFVWEKHNGSGSAADRFRQVHEEAGHWYRGPWSAVHHEVPREPAVYDPHHRIGDRLNAGADRIAHAGRIGSASYTYGTDRLARSVIYAKSMHRNAIHRTEKPVKVVDLLIRYACPPGGLVVEAFAGSCSAMVAARESGRRAIGIEMSEQQAERALRDCRR